MNSLTLEKDGISLKISRDYTCNSNPRTLNKNLGKMLCWHNNYLFGDENEFKTPFDFQMFMENNNKNIYEIIPICLDETYGTLILRESNYEESDKDIEIGFIYCTDKDVINFGFDISDSNTYFKVKEELENEIRDYNQYIQNSNKYFYYEIKKNNQKIAKKTGFFEEKTENMLEKMKIVAPERFSYLFNNLLKIEKENESCM